MSRRPAVAIVTFILAGCGEATVAPDAGVPNPDSLRARFDLRPLESVSYPPDNPYDPNRVALGRLLFYDPILSGERDVACGTCHHPDFAFADGRPLGVGAGGTGLGPGRASGVSAISGEPIGPEPRNAMTVLNAAFATDVDGNATHLGPMFWDGRGSGLEEQALIPIASRVEMRGDAYPSHVALDSVLARLNAIEEYRSRFAAAFPLAPAGEAISAQNLGRAVAAYERELVSGDSPFDRFARGDDAALSDDQLVGLELFFGRAKCFVCHRGASLTNFQFMVSGVPPSGPGKPTIPGDDLGREEHTGLAEDRYHFKVPSLRNVELTAPYMHNGVLETLDDVVRFYNEGAQPRHPAVTTEDLEVVLQGRLDLTPREMDALVAFLTSLTDPGAGIPAELTTVPAAVPSGLPPVFGIGADPH